MLISPPASMNNIIRLSVTLTSPMVCISSPSCCLSTVNFSSLTGWINFRCSVNSILSIRTRPNGRQFQLSTILQLNDEMKSPLSRNYCYGKLGRSPRGLVCLPGNSFLIPKTLPPNPRKMQGQSYEKKCLKDRLALGVFSDLHIIQVTKDQLPIPSSEILSKLV